MEESKTMWEAFVITNRSENEKAQWNKVGVAFLNRDDSINVLLDALPKDGKVQLRKKMANGKQQKPNGRREEMYE